ncbi:MAG: hypothetical protein Q9184_002692 [Pyrenodesmia sp. 2 TL-2023]
MANNQSGIETAFSKLVPASKNVWHVLPSPRPDRETPEAFRGQSVATQSFIGPVRPQPTGPGQMISSVTSHEESAESQGTELDRRELERLVAKLDNFAANPNEHSFTPADAAALSSCIKGDVRKTDLEFNEVNQALRTQVKDNQAYRLHAIFGDYCGMICKRLKSGGGRSSLTGEWPVISKDLDEEEESIAAWQRSGGAPAHEPRCPRRQTVIRLVNRIRQEGWTDIDLKTALLAIRTYARRCFIFHGETEKLLATEDQAGLARFLETDLRFFAQTLPEEELPLADNYRKIITFFQDFHSFPGELLENYNAVDNAPAGDSGPPAVEVSDEQRVEPGSSSFGATTLDCAGSSGGGAHEIPGYHSSVSSFSPMMSVNGAAERQRAMARARARVRERRGEG